MHNKKMMALLSLLIFSCPVLALKPTSQFAVAEQQKAPRAWFTKKNVLVAVGIAGLLYWKFEPSAASSSHDLRRRASGDFDASDTSSTGNQDNNAIPLTQPTKLTIDPNTVPANQLVTSLKKFGTPKYNGWWFVVKNKHHKNQLGFVVANNGSYMIRWHELVCRPQWAGFPVRSQPETPGAGVHDITKDTRIWIQPAKAKEFVATTIDLAKFGLDGGQLALTAPFQAILTPPQPLSAAAGAGAGAV